MCQMVIAPPAVSTFELGLGWNLTHIQVGIEYRTICRIILN